MPGPVVCEHTFVPVEPTILHADADSFYASVEQRDDPRLRGRPVIVGGGVVLAASYEAKRFGVRTPMPLGPARRLCPQAVVVPPRMKVYSEASKAMFAVFERTSAFVEALSIDEAFLNVGGLRGLAGGPLDIARRLKAQVRAEVGIPVSVGVARTKFLAKVASSVSKPDGLLLVPIDGELAFLHPLPVERLWGVGPVTGGKLRERGITTVGQVARVRESILVEILGPASGRHLHALAHNRDPRPVEKRRRRRSMGAQRALGRGHRSQLELEGHLVALVDRVTRRMRSAHRSGRTVVLRLRFDDYRRATRSRTLEEPTAETAVVLATVKGLLAGAMPLIAERGITLIGVAVGNLQEPQGAGQPHLAASAPGGSALDAAVDGVRNRFGSAAITRAVLLDRKGDPTVPLLED